VLETVAETRPDRLPATATATVSATPDAAAAPLPSISLPKARQRERKRQVSRWLRRALFTLVALGAVAATATALRPRPVPVELTRATRAPLTVAVEESGTVRIKDRFVVSAPVSGTLGRIAFEVGDTVKAGTPVAELAPMAAPLLDPRSRAEAEARLGAALSSEGQAGAQVARARAAQDQAEQDLARYRRLSAGGAVTEQAFEQAAFAARMRTDELQSALFGLETSGEQVRMARAALGRATGVPGAAGRAVEVRAPVSGKILRIQQKSAGVVAAGTPLLELGDDARLEVVVDLLTTDAVRVRPGSRAIVHGWGGDDLNGRVHRIEPSAFTRISALGVEEQRVNVVIDLDEPRARWANLGDGFRVEVRIVVAQVDRALTLPLGAVFRSGNRWAVFRVDQGVARTTPIEVGHRAEAVVEVAAGLPEGAEVVVHPGDRVRNDVRVQRLTPTGER
jgi:HlyD family secretion protein